MDFGVAYFPTDEAIRAMWTEDEAEYHGKHVDIDPTPTHCVAMSRPTSPEPSS